MPLYPYTRENNYKQSITLYASTEAYWYKSPYPIIIEQEEDGFFVAECPSLPGCVSQGSTREEALQNIREAMAGYIGSLKKHHEPIPPPI